MIFIAPSKLASRSSRATGPKTRVPRGARLFFSTTAAFSSKRSVEPSGAADHVLGADDDGLDDVALLDLRAGRRRLDGGHDDVADMGVLGCWSL